MIECIILRGCPGAGKSTWAKQKVSQDPDNWSIINNDQIRSMLNGSFYSPQYEKLVSKIRSNLITTCLKFNKNIIVDNVNADKNHFKEICKLAELVNIDIKVYEKPIYIELKEAVFRDSLRAGKERVGREIVTKFWNKLGKENFKNYQPKEEIFYKKEKSIWKPIEQNKSLERCIVVDNDGTICLIGNRSPYDASNCDEIDLPHEHVIEAVNLYYNAGYKIISVSGRQEKDRAPTERFWKKYLPNVQYELYMRPTGNMESDVIIKEKIYNDNIKDKYYVACWLDDRKQVSEWVYNNNLPLFRVNDPNATF